MTNDAYAIAVLTRAVASLLDPVLLALVALVAFTFTFLGSRKWAVIATIMVSTMIGLFLAQARHEMSRTSSLTLVDDDFQVWPAIAGTKYEEDRDFFVGIRSQQAMQQMKAKLDVIRQDCAVLVGPGTELIKRCDRQGMISTAIAGFVQGLILALIGLRLRRYPRFQRNPI